MKIPPPISSVDSKTPIQATHNDEWSWDRFDTDGYSKKNYLSMTGADRQIIERVSAFFDSVVRIDNARALDVGTGGNLYPVLLMLPFSTEIMMWEYSKSGVRWLRRKLFKTGWRRVVRYALLRLPRRRAWTWLSFWVLMQQRAPYRAVPDPWAVLADRVRVYHGNLKGLPPGVWYIGTMFFVAESMTRDPDEFRNSIEVFVAALRPGAPFAIALMEHSTGYVVGKTEWPAVSVGRAELEEVLARVADAEVHHIDIGSQPLRPGYSGMLLALGRVGVA